MNAPVTAHPPQPRPAVRTLSSSLIREVANAGMGRDDILPFWFGESDQPTPGFIRDAAVTSLLAGETFYSQNLGRPYLRETIATYLSNLHESVIGAERIAVTSSGVSGLMLANQLIVSPGDRVVVVTPIWPNVAEIPAILGARVHRVALEVRNGHWQLDTGRLIEALTPDTRLAIINSPNNPTGWTIDDESLDAIVAHCRRHGIWLVADDAYERLIYDPTRRSAPSVLTRTGPEDRVIVANTFSKAWTMTGWRIGWLTVPPALAPDLTKIIEYNTSCIPEPVQRAATVAIRDGEAEVAALRSHLMETRQLLVDGLRNLPGVEVPEAGGAMYVFFRIARFDDTLELAKRLVSEAGLGLAPGGAFGPEGDGWLRWCHAVRTERLQAGLERLATFLKR